MTMKVLIVDDEKLERVLIRKAIEMQDSGFEIVGEAQNGKDALEIAERKHPDIIITDINMPCMDGLELIQQITSIYEKTKVVIITGYRDFNYAHGAVKLGVKNFLLKPVDIGELTDTLQKLRQEIITESNLNQQLMTLKAVEHESKQLLIDSFLNRLVTNRVDQGEFYHKIQLYEFGFLKEQFLCIQIKLHFPHTLSDKEKEQQTEFFVLQLSRHEFHGKERVVFIHYQGSIICFLQSGTDDAQVLYGMKQTLLGQPNDASHPKLTIGVSGVHHGFEGIVRAFSEAEEALGLHVILGYDICVTYGDYLELKNQSSNRVEFDWSKFDFYLSAAMTDEAIACVDNYTGAIRKAGITNVSHMKFMGMNMISFVIKSLTGNTMPTEDEIPSDLLKLETLTELDAILKKMVQTEIAKSKQTIVRKPNQLVEKAVGYIDENLCDSGLNLKTVSGYLFVNDSYLSRVFKKEIGESLIEYITRKRIEKSIELLKTSDLKVYEIAESVGIHDPHYFGICFKKYVGKAIKEYKKSIQ